MGSEVQANLSAAHIIHFIYYLFLCTSNSYQLFRTEYQDLRKIIRFCNHLLPILQHYDRRLESNWISAFDFPIGNTTTEILLRKRKEILNVGDKCVCYYTKISLFQRCKTTVVLFILIINYTRPIFNFFVDKLLLLYQRASYRVDIQ